MSYFYRSCVYTKVVISGCNGKWYRDLTTVGLPLIASDDSSHWQWRIDHWAIWVIGPRGSLEVKNVTIYCEYFRHFALSHNLYGWKLWTKLCVFLFLDAFRCCFVHLIMTWRDVTWKSQWHDHAIWPIIILLMHHQSRPPQIILIRKLLYF